MCVMCVCSFGAVQHFTSAQPSCMQSPQAMTDDVLSLLILAVLTNLGDGKDGDGGDDIPVWWTVLRPIVASVGVGLVGLLQVWGGPRAVRRFRESPRAGHC